MGITDVLVTAVRIGEPGTVEMGIRDALAGLGGRKQRLGIIGCLATAVVEGVRAARSCWVSVERWPRAGGRMQGLGFTASLATAVRFMT
jgi:hypothetical protein